MRRHVMADKEYAAAFRSTLDSADHINELRRPEHDPPGKDKQIGLELTNGTHRPAPA